jgi:hypothetical protein
MRIRYTIYHSAINMRFYQIRDGQFFITSFANATPFAATLYVPIHNSVTINLEGP